MLELQKINGEERPSKRIETANTSVADASSGNHTFDCKHQAAKNRCGVKVPRHQGELARRSADAGLGGNVDSDASEAIKRTE